MKQRKWQPRDKTVGKLSKAVVTQLIQFREQHPPRRLSINLRNMLLDFLLFEGATESRYLQDLLYDLGGLFALLDVMESDPDHGKAEKSN